MIPDDLKRFWNKVQLSGSCWIWIGSKRDGYGLFGIGGKVIQSHRFSYELFNGNITDILIIDHLCRNRACVNPNHLDLVTKKENIRRGNVMNNPNHYGKNQIYCKRGHPLNIINIRQNHYIKYGKRLCIKCHNSFLKRKKGDE